MIGFMFQLLETLGNDSRNGVTQGDHIINSEASSAHVSLTQF
jgi:hypothetical protein